MEGSGADIDMGRETIIGMPDNPMVLNGMWEQVVAAVKLSNAVLQELVDRQRLGEDDFRYIAGKATGITSFPRGTQSTGARFVVPRGVAGFVIGKGGMKIRELKERTGASIQFRNAEEDPSLGLAETDRLLEIRGTAEQRSDGVRVLFEEVDTMPDGPREIRMLTPSDGFEHAATSCETLSSAGLTVQRGGQHGNDVQVILEGPVQVRINAVLAILELPDVPRVSTAISEATQPGARVTASNVDGRGVSATSSGGAGPMLNARVQVKSTTDDAEERRLDEDSGKVFTFREFQASFAGKYTADEIRDYWRDACKPVAPNAQSRSAEPLDRRDERQLPPAAPELKSQTHHQQSNLHPSPSQHVQQVHQPEQFQKQPEPSPQLPPPRQEALRVVESRETHQEVARVTNAPQNESSSMHTNSAQNLSGSSLQQNFGSSTFRGGASGFTGSGAFAQPQVSSPPCMPMGGTFNMMHQWHGGVSAVTMSRLQLLLPRNVVHDCLVPAGHLAEVARSCKVQIDLCDEVTPNMLRVTLTGTCVNNSLAALVLQWKLYFFDPSL